MAFENNFIFVNCPTYFDPSSKLDRKIAGKVETAGNRAHVRLKLLFLQKVKLAVNIKIYVYGRRKPDEINNSVKLAGPHNIIFDILGLTKTVRQPTYPLSQFMSAQYDSYSTQYTTLCRCLSIKHLVNVQIKVVPLSQKQRPIYSRLINLSTRLKCARHSFFFPSSKFCTPGSDL